ncbi:MAG TPA: response regulator transcription factor [Gemmatimonadaceae bacterium]|nr:response regulator transcription factor [Gemmatimonadaceae bacterium]
MTPLLWLVEDNALYRETVSEVLRGSGRFRGVREFADGESALTRFDGRGEIPQLVLMDIALPGMSGIDCVRALRQRTPSVPVVMLTVHQSNDRIFEAICAGASGYLLKSTPGSEIVSAVERVLDGGAAMDAQIARRVLEMFARMASPAADYGLSDRERQILQLLVDGLTKQQIAANLDLSPHTIDGHVRNIYMKLHVNNRSGAVAKALREHLL